MPSIIPGSLSPFARAPQIQNANYRIPLHHTVGLKSRGFGDGTCGRTNTGWYFDPADGLLKPAAANEERIEAKGLLVERAATNSLTRNRELDVWSESNTGTRTQNSIGVDGVANKAWTLDDTDAANAYYIYKGTLTPQDNTSYCVSCFVKKKQVQTSNYPALQCNISGSNPFNIVMVCDPITGNRTFDSGQETAPAHGTDEYGDWWRFWFRLDNTTNNTACTVYIRPAYNDDFSQTASAQTLGSIVVDYPQFEEGSVPTSVIPTVASAVTRNTDIANYTWPIPAAISAMLADEGTVICLVTPGIGNSDIVTNNQGILTAYLGTNGLFAFGTGNGGSIYGSDATTYPKAPATWIRGQTIILAIRWGYDDSGIKYELGSNLGSGWSWGTQEAFDGAFTDTGTLYIAAANIQFPFHIKNIYFHGLLTQAQVEAMY